MAIILDRLSYAVSGVTAKKQWSDDTSDNFHLLPQKWDTSPVARAIEMPLGMIWKFFGTIGSGITRSFAKLFTPISKPFAQAVLNRPFLVVGGMLLVLLYFFCGEFKWMNTFPRAWEFSIREPIDLSLIHI